MGRKLDTRGSNNEVIDAITRIILFNVELLELTPSLTLRNYLNPYTGRLNDSVHGIGFEDNFDTGILTREQAKLTLNREEMRGSLELTMYSNDPLKSRQLVKLPHSKYDKHYFMAVHHNGLAPKDYNIYGDAENHVTIASMTHSGNKTTIVLEFMLPEEQPYIMSISEDLL